MRHKLDKDTAALAQELERIGAFAALDRSAVEDLARRGRLIRVPKDWAVLIESQPADSAYLILEGDAEVRKGGETLATIGAGQLVGEAALVEHRTRNASVVTTGPVRVVRWSFEDLQALFAEHRSIEAAFSEQHRLRAS